MNLKQQSINHLNEAIKRLAENTRLTTIAQVTGNKNERLKLGLQKQSLEYEISYHRQNII